MNWPPTNKLKLHADYATLQEAQKFIDTEKAKPQSKFKDSPATPKPNEAIASSQNSRSEKDRDVRGRERERDRKITPQPPVKTLDQLFHKTEAKPSIYWKPRDLSEEEKKGLQSTNPGVTVDTRGSDTRIS